MQVVVCHTKDFQRLHTPDPCEQITVQTPVLGQVHNHNLMIVLFKYMLASLNQMEQTAITESARGVLFWANLPTVKSTSSADAAGGSRHVHMLAFIRRECSALVWTAAVLAQHTSIPGGDTSRWWNHSSWLQCYSRKAALQQYKSR